MTTASQRVRGPRRVATNASQRLGEPGRVAARFRRRRSPTPSRYQAAPRVKSLRHNGPETPACHDHSVAKGSRAAACRNQSVAKARGTGACRGPNPMPPLSHAPQVPSRTPPGSGRCDTTVQKRRRVMTTASQRVPGPRRVATNASQTPGEPGRVTSRIRRRRSPTPSSCHGAPQLGSLRHNGPETPACHDHSVAKGSRATACRNQSVAKARDAAACRYPRPQTMASNQRPTTLTGGPPPRLARPTYRTPRGACATQPAPAPAAHRSRYTRSQFSLWRTPRRRPPPRART